MQPLIINLALTGMVPTRKDTPHVPISPKEIAKTALRCAKLGVSVVHLHPRNKDGQPTWEKSIFEEIIGLIREQDKKLIISVTTSGRNWSEFAKRSACLEIKGKLKPDLASLTVGSMNFIKTASVNSPEMIKELALKMKANNIKPELEIFEPGMINTAKYLMKKNILDEEKPYFNLLLGSLGTSPLDLPTLNALMSQLPAGAIWSMAGIGLFQLQANLLALSLGGHLRTGLEDNIYLDTQKKELASNEKLVKRIVKLAQIIDRPIATPTQARKILGL